MNVWEGSNSKEESGRRKKKTPKLKTCGSVRVHVCDRVCGCVSVTVCTGAAHPKPQTAVDQWRAEGWSHAKTTFRTLHLQSSAHRCLLPHPPLQCKLAQVVRTCTRVVNTPLPNFNGVAPGGYLILNGKSCKLVTLLLLLLFGTCFSPAPIPPKLTDRKEVWDGSGVVWAPSSC